MFEVYVQADRIQSDDETKEAWLALKVSSALLDIAAPTSDDVNSLLPWKWTRAGDAAAEWDPHDSGAWQIWKIPAIDPTDPAPPPPTPSPVAAVRAVSRAAGPSDLHTRLEAAITAIAYTEGSVRADALHFNDGSKETDLRGTVPGFLERLAATPHPVPSASHVHCLLALDVTAADELNGFHFIAAPRLSLATGGDIDTSKAPTIRANGEDVQWELASGSNYRLVMKPSRIVADMRADPAQGRILDLFDQSIAVITDPRQTLPSAEALANLPQDLANAMNPIARLESVLPTAIAAWLALEDGGDRKNRLFEDLNQIDPVSRQPTHSRFKLMLDFIAAQILAARYDAVGRFEVPLMDSIQAIEGAEALFEAHRQALPVAPINNQILAAVRVDPQTIFPGIGPNDVPAKLSDVSPFTLARLREIFGHGETWTHPAPIEPNLETDILRRVWSNPSEIEAGVQRGTRYFELPRSNTAAAGTPIMLDVALRDVAKRDEVPHDIKDAKILLADISFDAVRSSAALAYAAPFVEGLVSGRTDWIGQTKSIESARPIADRLSGAMNALLEGDDTTPGLYKTLCDEAAKAAGLGTNDLLVELLARSMMAAAREAAQIAGRLGRGGDPFDNITPTPQPLAIQVDQFRTFSRHIDDWARLNGYGLLAARRQNTSGDNATPLWSLNRARMFFGESVAPIARSTGYLKDASDMHAHLLALPSIDAVDTTRLFVDPQPFAPGDQVGVSDAIAEFGNAWQTAPMPGEALLEGQSSAGAPAAQFLFGSPAPGEGRVPALSFGYGYSIVGHLVAQGGIVAPHLRDEKSPYCLASDIKADTLEEKFGIQIANVDNYPRTVGIGRPTITAPEQFLPADVTLLANEIPVRSPPQRLGATPLRVNYDLDRGVAALGWPSDGATAEMQFEFVVDAEAGCTIEINIADEQGILGVVPVVEVAAAKGCWYRVNIQRSGLATLWRCPVGLRAEDEYQCEESVAWTQVAIDKFPPSLGDGVWLTLSSQQSAQIERTSVGALVAGAEAPTAKNSQAANKGRSKPILLDGLDPHNSNGRIATSLKLDVHGPSVDRDTWERWVNCALFAVKSDAAVKQRVAEDLDRLQREGASNRKELPDPAVTNLWVELWSIFPQRQRVGEALPISPRRPFERASGTVDLIVAADSEAASLSGTGGFLEARCKPGAIYELRVRAGILERAAPYDKSLVNIERFSPAVIESGTREKLGGEDWLLGPAMVCPIEVATGEMPILDASAWAAEEFAAAQDAALPSILRVTGEREQRCIELRLPSGLFGSQVGEARRRLRYCSKASLIPQRWSWRGRPHPFTKDSRQRFNLAFIDRRDDDVGSIASGDLSLVHALGVERNNPFIPPDKLSPVLSRGLDWRGGWNLWRFGVRIESRYFGLFRAAKQQQAIRDLRLIGGNWLNLDVRDAPNGREVAKPPIRLILPLTEAFEDGARVPPLLALMAGAMHENDHFGDGLLVTVDTVRHPYPQFQQEGGTVGKDLIDQLKFLPEFGPDPIRSEARHWGAAVPLRIDGPIGYGFDAGFEAGRFDHSGFLIAPADATPQPWSMIRLKFCRFEEPDGLSSKPKECENDELPIWCTEAEALAVEPSPVWAVCHEGLILEPDFGANPIFKLRLVAEPADADAGQRVELELSGSAGKWELSAWVLFATDTDRKGKWTHDGAANAGHMRFSASERPEIRVVISARPRPDRGETWRPAGEISVQARTESAGDSDGSDRWTSLFSLPIEAESEIPIYDSPQVRFEGRVIARPVRLSEYAPPIWCQFTVASSQLDIFEAGSATPSTETQRIGELKLAFAGQDGARKWSDLCLRHKSSWQSIDRSGAPTADASVDELHLAVLTETVRDVFNRPRENPLIVSAITEADITLPDKSTIKASTLGQRFWPAHEPAATATMNGQWRLMRVLVRKGRPIHSLEDLFAEPLGDAIINNPGDGRGMILSISEPAPWSFANI